jgi:hypothetical protein
MRRLTRAVVVATASVGLMLGTQLSSAHAALDMKPPTLTVPVRPSFVVGSVVDDYPIDQYWYARNIAQLIKWSATDNVGVCSYDLYDVPAGDEPGPILEYSQETQYTYPAGTDYDDDFGGGSQTIDGFQVTARDCTGNETTKVMSEHIFVFQEDGIAATSYQWVQPITYSGAWGQSNCGCFLADHTAFTKKSGASVKFTRTYEKGDQVALVMAKGPGRGRASIRLDGKWLMNIDTFASVNTNRVVVFARGMRAGVHTLTVVNQATPGRQRIDLDAILIGKERPGP